MPLILAIEPDKRQAAQLKALARNRLHADLIVADTTELALEAIGDRVPDLVLVPALLSPEEDGALAAALRVIAVAAHVQTLTIPVFASHARKAAKPTGVLAKLMGGKTEAAPEGCDPAVFGDQIAAYLAEAAGNRESLDYDGEDDFAEQPPPAPSRLARVQTFAPVETFEAAVDEFKSADVFAAAEQPAESPVEPEPYQHHEPGHIVTSVEINAPSVEVYAPIVLTSEPAPPDPFANYILDPVPDPEPAGEALEPRAAPAEDNWFPPADQSIALDQPDRTEQPIELAASEAPVAEEINTAEDAEEQEEEAQEDEAIEEATWAEHEAIVEPIKPPVHTPQWTQPSVARMQSWPHIEGIAAEPAPPDLLAEFTADLVVAPPPPPPPKPVAAPPPAPKPAPKPAPAPPPPPKPVAKPAAKPAAQAAPPPAPVAPPPRAKSERPEWTALIESLRQDMERMRNDRSGIKRSAPMPPPPPRPPVEPEPREVPIAAAAAAAPAATAPAVSAPAVSAPTVSAPAATVAQDLAAKKKKRAAQKGTPVQDEWGFFDPEQCGFAALLAKLDEITDNDDGSKRQA